VAAFDERQLVPMLLVRAAVTASILREIPPMVAGTPAATQPGTQRSGTQHSSTGE